jgi:CrcB protein
MPWHGIVAVGGGAAVGAWLRWGQGALLNPLFPMLPPGIAAHVVGSVALTILGIALARSLFGWSSA